MTFYQKQKQLMRKNGGFTLIEVLIAVVIFSTSLAGLLLMVGTGIGNVNVAKNRLVANYLAQEGIEIMRYKRDYLMSTQNWAAFASMMNNVCTLTSPCGVSALHPLDVPNDCGSGNPTGCRIVQDLNGSTATGAYAMMGDPGVSGWEPTIYSRKIYLETPLGNNNTDSYIIHSLVSYQDGTATYTLSMSETLFNWQE